MAVIAHITRISLVLMVVMGAAGLIAGCHESHGTVAARESDACADCRLTAQTMPGAGTNHTACTCPSCRDTSTLDESTPAALEQYIGGQAGATVHTCARCEDTGVNSWKRGRQEHLPPSLMGAIVSAATRSLPAVLSPEYRR